MRRRRSAGERERRNSQYVLPWRSWPKKEKKRLMSLVFSFGWGVKVWMETNRRGIFCAREGGGLSTYTMLARRSSWIFEISFLAPFRFVV